MNAPLILTLGLDDSSQRFFDELRGRYFPPERNFLRAHCTLFHALPGSEDASIRASLDAAAKETAAFALTVASPKFIGRGVAYGLEGSEAVQLHARLQKLWWDWLSQQDRQKLWPHVTVQNKVSPDEAKATLKILSEKFRSFTATATALHLWAYLSGPWELLSVFPFANPQDG